MPVKVKNKFSGLIETITYSEWLRDYDHDLWDLLAQWDITEIYHRNKKGEWVLHNTIELSDAIAINKQHPNYFKLVRLPDLPKRGNLLWTKPPIKYIINSAKNNIIKFFNNKWAFNILCGVIGSAIFFLLVKYWPF